MQQLIFNRTATMNLLEFSDLLKQLLCENEVVNLPGMGRLVIENIPSRLVNEGKTITPPSVQIIFESVYDESDKALFDACGKSGLCAKGDVVNEVAELLRQLKKTLIDTGRVELTGLGVIRFGGSGNFIFETNESFDAAAYSYGLEPLSLKIKAESEIAADETVKTDVQTDIQAVAQEGDLQTDVPEDPQKDSQADALEDAQKDLQTDVQAGPQKESRGTEQTEPEQPTLPKTAEKRKTGKIVFAICMALGVIILTIILLAIFKEQLMPLLQKLLYSKEELNILERAGEL